MVVNGNETYSSHEPLAHNAISQQFCATAIGSNDSQAGTGSGSRQFKHL
jgi:hypothetical protein